MVTRKYFKAYLRSLFETKYWTLLMFYFLKNTFFDEAAKDLCNKIFYWDFVEILCLSNIQVHSFFLISKLFIVLFYSNVLSRINWVVLNWCPRIKHDINDWWRAEWCLIETDVGGLNHTMRPSKRSLILCLVRGWSFKRHSDTSVKKNTEKYVWRAWREKRNKGNT